MKTKSSSPSRGSEEKSPQAFEENLRAESDFPSLADAVRAVGDGRPLEDRTTVVVLHDPISISVRGRRVSIPRNAAVIGPVLFTEMFRDNQEDPEWDNGLAPVIPQVSSEGDVDYVPVIRGDYFGRTEKIAIVGEMIVASKDGVDDPAGVSPGGRR